MFPETPLRMVAADLQLGYPVPGPLVARAGDTDAHGLRIDARLEYYSGGGTCPSEVVLAIVVEAQLSHEADLRWRLCPYIGYVSHDCRCATDVVIICQTRGLAKSLARPMLLGARGSQIVPCAIGPDQVPVIGTLQDALADPGLLMLSAWYHTRRGTGQREALVSLILQVTWLFYQIDPEKAERYYELALAILPTASARRLQEMTDTTMREITSPFHLKEQAKGRRIGRHEGRVEGRAEDILTILAARGVSVPAETRKQIKACDDLRRLKTWLKRAVTARTIDDVIKA